MSVWSSRERGDHRGGGPFPLLRGGEGGGLGLLHRAEGGDLLLPRAEWAGKSTTINVLTTLLPLQKGEVRVAGYDIVKDPALVRNSIGIVFQEVTLDRDMTVWEILEFHGRLYNMPVEERRKRIEELLVLVELAGKLLEARGFLNQVFTTEFIYRVVEDVAKIDELGVQKDVEEAKAAYTKAKAGLIKAKTAPEINKAKGTLESAASQVYKTEKALEFLRFIKKIAAIEDVNGEPESTSGP
jgi:ABC-type branched-subunit amino acid transport system ATPase component